MPNAKIAHEERDSVVRTARQHTITPTRMYTAEVSQSRIGSSTERPPIPRMAWAPVAATSAIRKAVARANMRRSVGRSPEESGSSDVPMAGISDAVGYIFTVGLFG